MKSILTCKKQVMNQDEATFEVLYQKMGDRWFAFSLIHDEIFMGSISQTDIDQSTNLNPHLSYSPKKNSIL